MNSAPDPSDLFPDFSYALVSLYESGYADQNDLARSFDYSTRTLPRFPYCLSVSVALPSRTSRPDPRTLG